MEEVPVLITTMEPCQKMEKDSEERLNEISRSQGSETKIGIKRNVEELQEKEEQPFLTASGTERKTRREGSRRRRSGGRKVKY